MEVNAKKYALIKEIKEMTKDINSRRGSNYNVDIIDNILFKVGLLGCFFLVGFLIGYTVYQSRKNKC